MKLIIIIMIFLNIGCSTVLPKMSADTMYQRDLRLEIQVKKPNGKWSGKHRVEGYGVVPAAEHYRVTVFAVGKADMITLHSCHREVKTASPKPSWWTGGYTFEFQTSPTVEIDKNCMIEVGLYEKEKGRHGWATVALENRKAKLTAKTECNGKRTQWKGTSFCQAKESLIQVIEFPKKVDVSFYGDCRLKKPKNGKKWQYLMPRGKCILNFFDDDLNEHVHYMFGYDTIPIRGVDGGTYENDWGGNSDDFSDWDEDY